MINLIKKNYRKILIILVITYACYTFVMQQKDINTYKRQQQDCLAQINIAKEKQEELTNIKENAESIEYIEKVARESLDMYLPNERVYIDIGR